MASVELRSEFEDEPEENEGGFNARASLLGAEVGVSVGSGPAKNDPVRMMQRTEWSRLAKRDRDHTIAMNTLTWTHVFLLISMVTFHAVITMDQASMSRIIQKPFSFVMWYTITNGVLFLIAFLGILIPKLMGKHFKHHATNWSFRTAAWILLFAIFAINTVGWWTFEGYYGNNNPHNIVNLFALIDYRSVTMIGSVAGPYVVFASIALAFAFGEPHRDTGKKWFLV